MKKELLIDGKENKQLIEKNEKDIWNNPLLKNVIKEINKEFGDNAIIDLDFIYENLRIDVISSGSYLINDILGVQGYPRGRIVEIYGPESSGKTTLGLHAIAEVQKIGGIAVFIDVEHSLDLNYAKNLGIDIRKILISQPDNGEQALDILERLVKTNLIDIIILDSVAALTPKVELEGDMSDQTIGLQARLMSKALRKLNGIISKTNTLIIFTNQLREKVGVIFGNPEITPGGRALKFYSSIRVEVRKGESVVDDGIIIGNKVKVKIVKNKVAAPFKIATITINYNKGIDQLGEIIDMAVKLDIITKSGTWYSYNSYKIGQGQKTVRDWLIENTDKYNDIISELKLKNISVGNN